LAVRIFPNESANIRLIGAVPTQIATITARSMATSNDTPISTKWMGVPQASAEFASQTGKVRERMKPVEVGNHPLNWSTNPKRFNGTMN
jgi:hypothetical protein